MLGLASVFGMGTGVSPAPWAPILAFVTADLPIPTTWDCAVILLAKRGVDNAPFLARRTVCTPYSKSHYLLALHPGTNPKTLGHDYLNDVHAWRMV